MNPDHSKPEEAFSNEHQTVHGEDPFQLFGDWLNLAHQKELNDANAMALATADEDGLPNVRMVLLKDFDTQGFVFYSNTKSQKGVELGNNMQASAVFHWKSLRRQVRLRGTVSFVTDAEADAYFQSRARASRIGAWASTQSQPLESRTALKKKIAIEVARLGIGHIPRPPYWTGYRIIPTAIEFWMDKPFRLHDRLAFSRENTESPWTTTRLFP